jgi:hypothetical protein
MAPDDCRAGLIRAGRGGSSFSFTWDLFSCMMGLWLFTGRRIDFLVSFSFSVGNSPGLSYPVPYGGASSFWLGIWGRGKRKRGNAWGEKKPSPAKRRKRRKRLSENLSCLRRFAGKGAAGKKRCISGGRKIRKCYRKNEPHFRLPFLLSGE